MKGYLALVSFRHPLKDTRIRGWKRDFNSGSLAGKAGIMPSISTQRTTIATRLLARLNLRFPGLFLLLGFLTLADLLIPDFIPFADEIGLALLTLLFGSWKNRSRPAAEDDGFRSSSR
jgi:hypothetical protein